MFSSHTELVGYRVVTEEFVRSVWMSSLWRITTPSWVLTRVWIDSCVFHAGWSFKEWGQTKVSLLFLTPLTSLVLCLSKQGDALDRIYQCRSSKFLHGVETRQNSLMEVQKLCRWDGSSFLDAELWLPLRTYLFFVIDEIQDSRRIN